MNIKQQIREIVNSSDSFNKKAIKLRDLYKENQEGFEKSYHLIPDELAEYILTKLN
jgi:hypothetical protein